MFVYSLIIVCATICIYIASRFLYFKSGRHPLLLPVLTSTAVIVILISITDLTYTFYMNGGAWLDHFLGPAVVALAYPLYRQKARIIALFRPFAAGIALGAASGAFTGFYGARMLGVENYLYYSVVPKSVTTPVAAEVSELIGGSSSVAALFVMVAGIGGAVIGQSLLRRIGVIDPFSQGLALGAASHAIGTAKALEDNEEAGAAGTIAMTVSAAVMALLIPGLIDWLP
ncbi:putative effector of murein hydrolase [Salsuginibacillus halophilus]|uniref:Putative effector of murein hydrolase n=2 Tax=Salsuginibacillus halophilus TaxID=517424 RepID=A0A2P8HEA1_9BACI|nr:putative effector of murein hydrolase [Salsuginibacillus halophilus]